MSEKRIKTIGIVVNPHKNDVAGILSNFDNWANGFKSEIIFQLCTNNSSYINTKFNNFILASENDLIKKADVIVTLGGDGTILRTVSKLNNTDPYFLGVNLGGLGFLANTPPDKLTDHLEDVISGHYSLEKRTLLTIRQNGSQEKIVALNDFVIDKAGFSRVIQIDVKVNGKKLNSYIADGLIVSTPTGSTGYSFSAGGPIVAPQSNVIVINPICPHSLTNRPVIVPDDTNITIQVWTEHESFNIMRDGENQGGFPSGSRFIINKNKKTVSFIKMKSQNFFKTLSKKLNWGDDFRNKKRWTYQKS